MANAFIEVAAGGEVPEGIGIFLPAIYDIVWSLVPATLILVFFWKYAVPKFRQIIDDRTAAIEGGIVKAEVAQAEAQELLAQYSAQLEQARTDANEIREEARRDGQNILAELKEQAQGEAARILATAQAQIEADRQAALVSLRAEVGTLALDLAGSVLGEKLSGDKAASAVVDRFLADLNSDSKVKAGK